MLIRKEGETQGKTRLHEQRINSEQIIEDYLEKCDVSQKISQIIEEGIQKDQLFKGTLIVRDRQRINLD
jgi:hypothetical protein